MTREEAKIWASIPREKLAVIMPNIDRHWDTIVAYANGTQVQTSDMDTREWLDDNDPKFLFSRAYRVKPSEAQPAEPWTPQLGYKFFFLTTTGSVAEEVFAMCEPSSRRVDFGNCFRTCEEAEAARERVRAALKGETISKTETVESLDGKPLTDAEKEVLTCLRSADCEIEKVFQFESDWERGIELIVCNDGGRRALYDALKKFAKKGNK